MRHILSVLVENKPGVLSRVTGLISRAACQPYASASFTKSGLASRSVEEYRSP